MITFLLGDGPYLDGTGVGVMVWNVVVLVFVLITFGALLVCSFKGRWGWFVLGLFVWPVAWYGAFQPALPGSYWASRF